MGITSQLCKNQLSECVLGDKKNIRRVKFDPRLSGQRLQGPLNEHATPNCSTLVSGLRMARENAKESTSLSMVFNSALPSCSDSCISSEKNAFFG